MKSFLPFDLDEQIDTHHLRSVLLTMAKDRLAANQDHLNNDPIDLLNELLGETLCRQLGIYHVPDGFLLSVVMPVFNEARTIDKIIQRVRDSAPPCEIVVVDDGSTDGTRETLKQFENDDDVKIVLHNVNQGKGAALKTGFAHVKGEVVVIQDADMEYDPRDFWLLLQPILEDRADVVYGSRFLTNRHASPQWHQSVNRLITKLSNISTGLKYNDVETCYKMFRRKEVEQLAPTLREKGFGIELELTAKLARIKNLRFYERPISYDRRSYSEGKKIGWRDGIWALWCILRY